MKQIRFMLMAFVAILTILGTVSLQATIGAWALLIYFALFIAFCYATRAWKWTIGMIFVTSYVLSFVGLLTRVIHTEDGIQIVSKLYPLVNKVFMEGEKVDTITVYYGYSTYAGWLYNIEKGRLYAVTDSNHLTTIIDGGGTVVLKGYQLQLDEYKGGNHGPVTIFSYIDTHGVCQRHDYYGNDPYAPEYQPHIRDDVDYILNYNM